MSKLLVVVVILSILACGGSSSSDSGRPPRDSAGDTAGGEGGGEGVGGLVEREDPCQGAGTPYGLLFTSATEGWVGCGNGVGLWHTTDGGATFTSGHPDTPTGDLYVERLVLDDEGRLLLCGHDYATTPGTLLYRRDGDTWTELLHYGSNAHDDSAAQLANCGAVAAAGDGTMIVASDTSGDLTYSEDDGATWTEEERYWEDANLSSGGYSYYSMLELVAAGGSYYGAGSDITTPPTFFAPTRSPKGDWTNFAAVTVAPSVEGELWALATPDDGETWVVGGRDEAASAEPSGFLYTSTDGGDTWSGGRLGGTLDVVKDVVFASDGRRGVAVGHRYPPTSLGGFVLTTDDGGATWDEQAGFDVPPLYRASFADGTAWVAGDGYLASFAFDD